MIRRCGSLLYGGWRSGCAMGTICLHASVMPSCHGRRTSRRPAPVTGSNVDRGRDSGLEIEVLPASHHATLWPYGRNAWPMNFCPAGCGGLLGGWVPRRGVLRLTRSGSISPISIAISATMLSRAWPFCPANRKRICCAEPCGPTSPSIQTTTARTCNEPCFVTATLCSTGRAAADRSQLSSTVPSASAKTRPTCDAGGAFPWKWSATPMAVC